MRRTSLRGQFLSSRDLGLSWRVVVMKSFLSASIKIETGVEAIADSVQGTVPRLYDGIGLYGCMQGIYKITYDIGLGAELFGEFSARQSLGGIKLIVFFSSAYVGPKKNYNPNVRKQPK